MAKSKSYNLDDDDSGFQLLDIVDDPHWIPPHLRDGGGDGGGGGGDGGGGGGGGGVELYDPSGRYGLPAVEGGYGPPANGGAGGGGAGQDSPFDRLLDAIERLIDAILDLTDEATALRAGAMPPVAGATGGGDSPAEEGEGNEESEWSSRKVKGKLGFAADAASAVVSNDGLGVFNKAIEGASAGLEKLGPVGMVAGKALEVVGFAVNKFIEVVNAINQRAAELAKYSGELSATQARRSIRELQSDIKEAQALGRPIAAVDDASSSIQNDIRTILLPIKRFIIEFVGKFLESVQPMIEKLAFVAEAFLSYYEKNRISLAVTVALAKSSLPPFLQFLNLATDFLTGKKEKDAADLGAETLRLLEQSILGLSPNADRSGPVGLNVPIFGGR